MVGYEAIDVVQKEASGAALYQGNYLHIPDTDVLEMLTTIKRRSVKSAMPRLQVGFRLFGRNHYV